MGINSLMQLSAIEFENLVYDVVVASGLENAVWRTPGHDVGRDIEGDYAVVDFSGYRQPQRWYVECKRYESSLDWPTVREKLSYAEAHDADCLLVVTAATVSPQAVDQINLWNEKHSKPRIRFWTGSELVNIVSLYPTIAAKYRIAFPAPKPAAVLFPLSLLTLKFVDSAYSTAVFNGTEFRTLEAAAALADLALNRLTLLEQGAKWRADAVREGDLYDWCQVSVDSVKAFDRYALRAILAVLRTMTKDDHLEPQVAEQSISLSFSGELSRGQRGDLSTIAQFSNFELTFAPGSIVMRPRRE